MLTVSDDVCVGCWQRPVASSAAAAKATGWLSCELASLLLKQSRPAPTTKLRVQEADPGADAVSRLQGMAEELAVLAARARPPPPGPPGSRPMTFEEKRRLSIAIGEAPPKVLGEVMLVCSQDPAIGAVSPCASRVLTLL